MSQTGKTFFWEFNTVAVLLMRKYQMHKIIHNITWIEQMSHCLSYY